MIIMIRSQGGAMMWNLGTITSADTQTREQTGTTQDIRLETNIAPVRRGTACQPTTACTEAAENEMRKSGGTGSLTMMATRSITTNLRSMQQRGESLGANHQLENTSGAEPPKIIVHHDMGTHRAIAHQSTIIRKTTGHPAMILGIVHLAAIALQGARRLTVIDHRDINHRSTTGRRDTLHWRHIGHLGENHLSLISREEAPGPQSDYIENISGEGRGIMELE